MASQFKSLLLHMVLPLLAGSVLYIGFRSEDLRMFRWFETIGIIKPILDFRAVINPYESNLPDWVYYSLPDGLWVYAFASAYLILWRNDLRAVRLWLLFPLVFGCLAELAQGMGILRGTFDLTDLSLCSIALLLSISIFNQSIFKYEQTKQTKNHQ